jgi:uncharacterized membrane protein YphA (DoxX/SURF4 family)
METHVINTMASPVSAASATADRRTAGAIAVKLGTIRTVLRLTFTIVPIVAGLDKFTNLLTNWEQYLNPMVSQLLPVSPQVFMGIVGVIEIVAGIIVFSRPRLGALIVSTWLTGIALSLLASGHFLDVAVRDLVMAVSAFTLASLTAAVE